MVNSAVTEQRRAERALAVSYAPAPARAALGALLALDDLLGGILRSTREPLVGQMRLTWWHDALKALDAQPAPAHPVLVDLASQVLLRGVSVRELADMVDGWEALLAEPLDAEAMLAFAEARGGGLFAAAAVVLSVELEPIRAAGQGWALADLAVHLADPRSAAIAAALSAERLGGAFAQRWPRPARSLGALALLARADLAGVPPGSPRRVGRLLRHRFTGR